MEQLKDTTIDCHSHLSLMSKEETWEMALRALILDMEKNKIGKRIIIGDNVENSNCASTKRLIEITKDYDNLYIIGSINPFDFTDQGILYFDELIRSGKIAGLKIFPGHDRVFVGDKSFLPSVELCLKYDIPLTIHTGINTNDNDCAKYNDPALIAKLAKDCPKLKIIISHFFWPNLDYCFKQTISLKNIYYDTSGLADHEVLDASGGIDKMSQVLEKTLREKPQSVLFGTDYPMCNTSEHIKLIDNLGISPGEKANILINNATLFF